MSECPALDPESPVSVLSVSESPPECVVPVVVLVPWVPPLVLPFVPWSIPGVVGGGMLACVCVGAWYRNGVIIAAIAAIAIVASPTCRLLSGIIVGIKFVCPFLFLPVFSDSEG